MEGFGRKTRRQAIKIEFSCIRFVIYRVCSAASSAPFRSSTRSWQLSTPTERRMRVSSMPSLALSSSGTLACVIKDGDSARDSTAPRDSASAKTCNCEQKESEHENRICLQICRQTLFETCVVYLHSVKWSPPGNAHLWHKT
jgi:hypothetical protein